MGTQTPAVRLLFPEAGKDGIQIGLGHLGGDPGLHPPKDDHLVSVAIGLVRHRVGDKKVDVCPRCEDGREVEAGGEDTRYGAGHVVQDDGVSNQPGFRVEAAPPVVVGKKHRRGASPHPLFLRETPSV